MIRNTVKFTGKKAVSIFVSATALLLTLFLSSCKERPIGYGIMLWAEDDTEQQEGEMYNIYEDSELNDNFIIGIDHPEIIIDRWRVEKFKKEKDAEVFQQKFQPYSKIFARVIWDGLLVRGEPDADSDRIYKFKLNETVKIIDRASDKEKIGEYEDYWYEVITQDGSRGYTFGHYLEQFDPDIVVETAAAASPEESLESFWNNIYRPEYYEPMVRNNTIDLLRFSDYYGIFPDRENQTILIRTPTKTLELQYSGITQLSDGKFRFDGANMELVLKQDGTINVTYYHNDWKYSENYIILPDVETYIEEESKRRATLYENLINHGTEFESSAYGTITLSEEGRFSWNEYARLIPNVIPPQSGNSGSVSHRYLMEPVLQSSYDGALTFIFDESPDNPVSFLYKLNESGIKLSYVPETIIEWNTVVVESRNPIIIFFNTIR